MPEYLAPGVYIEEIDIGPKPIEGVSTSTAAFLGATERGPKEPKLITNFEDFQRLYGGFIPESYLTYSVEGFFRNGGKRCYIARVYKKDSTFGEDETAAGEGTIKLKSTGPGEWGDRIYYKIEDSSLHSKDNDPEKDKFFKLVIYYFPSPPEDPDNPGFDNKKVEQIIEIYDNLSVNPSSNSYYKNMIAGISNFIRIWDNFDTKDEKTLKRPATIAQPKRLEKVKATGNNSNIPNEDYEGETENELDNGKYIKTGLIAIQEIEDISILCIPDANEELSKRAVSICEQKNKFAIINTPREAAGSIETIEPFQDSKYAAIYFPWIYINDPLTRNKKLIPPVGHMAGIYARVDVERGVHKAPANEVVGGILSLQVELDKGKQEILNPKGVNVIRSFPGRGTLVWGARTMSRDPMWKYINVRRLFTFIEKSVDRSTQWAVFEPNNERLWSRIKASLTQFLTTVWQSGALMGTTPEESFFVRVDRTTMTQNDIDNGRLIVVVGIAPTKPAEFVIFRFAQTQAGAKITEI
jgi:phage tail sheath protein FI